MAENLVPVTIAPISILNLIHSRLTCSLVKKFRDKFFFFRIYMVNECCAHLFMIIFVQTAKHACTVTLADRYCIDKVYSLFASFAAVHF